MESNQNFFLVAIWGSSESFVAIRNSTQKKSKQGPIIVSGHFPCHSKATCEAMIGSHWRKCVMFDSQPPVLSLHGEGSGDVGWLDGCTRFRHNRGH